MIMKKGQKVRVLADGRVGIVADSHFFHWGHKKMVQHQVKFPDTTGEAPWFPSEKLGSIIEKSKMTITGENKEEIILNMELNHETKQIEVQVLMEPVEKKTLPLEMLRFFVQGCRRCTGNVELLFNQ